jgi:hypothetical protein
VRAGAIQSESRVEDIVDEEYVSPAKVSSAMFQAANFSGRLSAFITGNVPKFHLGIGIEVAEEVDDKENAAFEKGNDGERAVLVGLADRRGKRSDATLDREGREVGLARGAGH